MAERDPFELVEMSPGAQPPSGFGDRILVGLALVALVGGALIAVANLLPHHDGVADASIAPSEQPKRTPRPSPTPAPPRVATLQDPDIRIVPPEQQSQFDGWIRALVDLTIRSSPDPKGTSLGVMKQGDVGYASQMQEPTDEPGWLFLQDSQGWVATIAGGEQLAHRYSYPQVPGSGSIENVTAGPDGFVAIISPPGDSSSYGPPRPAFSTDGMSWRSAAASAFDGWWVSSVASGPAGWLAAGDVSEGSESLVMMWSSPDGLRWTRLGILAGRNGDYVIQMVGSQGGYLLETQQQVQNSGSGTTLWSSADGLTWNESVVPLSGANGDRHIVPLAGGFYMWEASEGAFSPDGMHWSAVDGAPDGVNLQVTNLQGRAVAIDLDPSTLAPRVWGGLVARGRLEWHRLASSDDFFAGGVVTQVVSDGNRVSAFGWDRSTERPLVWTGDGAEWVRTPLPESFGGHPLVAAAGPRGVVVVGYRHTLRGDNPIAWHRAAVGGWLPEPDPILALVPDPTSGECPAIPTEYLDLTVVDVPGVVSCHGDAPITFQAFSVPCGGCAGSVEGNPQPAWLMNPFINQLYLTPNRSHSDWQSRAVLGPGLTLEPEWTGNMLRLTGHFDDAAASTCHTDLTADQVRWSTGQQSIMDGCRQTFVVTAVTVLPGP
jgi:hypothetical protein